MPGAEFVPGESLASLSSLSSLSSRVLFVLFRVVGVFRGLDFGVQ